MENIKIMKSVYYVQLMGLNEVENNDANFNLINLGSWLNNNLHYKAVGIDINIAHNSVHAILTDNLAASKIGDIRNDQNAASGKVQIGIECF